MDNAILLLSAVILTTTFFGHAHWFGTDIPLDHSNGPINWVKARTHLNTESETDYDFIIVGAGSAGSVIANRLSEINNWKVLLLEAGLPEDTLSEFPTLSALLQFTDYNWGYTTEPEAHACLAMEERRCAWPRGKALGGTSSINYILYTRGNPEDYNRWAALGNPGWSYAEVLPYFLKSEGSRLNVSDAIFHNREGYLSVENSFISELGNAFIEAGQELGYQNVDYNSPDQIGFSKMQATMSRGRRHSAAKAFLIPVLDRDNLEVLTGVTVTKILINSLTNTAYGVEYDWGGKNFAVKARKEVIVSAGVINSPQLLMLSGVGPKNHLTELGIETLSDLPVGQTIYDHPVFFGLVIETNFTTDATASFDPKQLLEWFTIGTGPLSSLSGYEALAFLKTNMTEEVYPDIELILGVNSIASNNGTVLKRVMRLSDEYYNAMYLPLVNTNSFSIVPILLHPKSKGFMKLKSSNPYDYPLLYANYFTDPENRDIQTFVQGIRLIQKLCETKVFKRYNARINKKPFVGCEHLPYDADEYWRCVLHLMTVSTYHQTSTCKMGPPNDPTAVVNPDLKVYGIGKLRVADASILPVTISGHTNGPAIMIGEVASDLIKREWDNL